MLGLALLAALTAYLAFGSTPLAAGVPLPVVVV